MDSGKTIDSHLSHLMFPPSYGWKDLFNLRCVFLGDQLGFDLCDGLGNPKVCLLWSKGLVVVGPVVGGIFYS